MKQTNIKIGAVITYVQLFLNIIISLLYTPMMLRILGPQEHGLFATVSSAISFLGLLGLGIGSSYIRFYSKYKAQKDEDKLASLNGLFLLMFTVIGVVIFACGMLLSANVDWMFKDGMDGVDISLARTLSVIVTVDLAMSFPASIFNSIIRANEHYIWVKSINMFQSVLTPLLTIPALLMGFGSVGMVMVTTIIDGCAYVFNILFCLFKLKAKFSLRHIERGIFKSIFAFSIFIAINSIISQFNTGLDKLLLAKYVGTVSVSVYTIGFSLYNYYGAFSSAISSLFAPHIHRVVQEHDEDPLTMRRELTSIFVKLGRIQFLLQMLLLTGIVFFGQAFISLWAGAGYENAYYVALILCAAYTIPLCQNIGQEIQRAQNKHQIRTLVYAVMTVLNIALTIVLCRRFGEIGAVVGTGISVLVVEVIFMNIYYHRQLNIDIGAYWRSFLSNCRGLILPIAVGVCLRLFVPIDSIIALIGFAAIYTAVYGLSMWLLVMNDFEKDLLFGKIRKVFRRKRV